jgi:hypothetical protein
MANSSPQETAPSTYWFKRRRYGIGWVPATPQGWISLAAFIGALLLPKALMDKESRAGTPGKIWKWGLSAGFLAFVWTRGPKPRWRWGARPDDNPLEDA